MDPAIPRAENPIQQEPSEKLQKMGTGNGRNFMPDDRPGVLRMCNTWLSKRKAFNALRIEMDFAMLFARQAFEQFGKRALGAMTAVDKG